MFPDPEEISVERSQVCKFYDGQSIFITGAAGFLGTVILETLLRCCPGILRIYILLRPKKGSEAQERKQQIFEKQIFNHLKEKDPSVLEKVIVIPGDVAQENLGMCEADWLRTIEDVSVVFHCAAVISFTKTLSYTIEQNVMGTYNVINFCRNLANLKALVYSSSAFCNMHRKVIEEKVYGMPFTAEKVMELFRTDETGLNDLYSDCKTPFENFYMFSKCVAESLLAEKAHDLPVAIVRPSIILCSWKGVMPGFLEGDSALMNIILAIGRGFARVVRVNKATRIELIPVDIAANTHILAAYHQASERLPSPFVYNGTAGDMAPTTIGEGVPELVNLFLKHPLPRTFQKPSVIMCKSSVTYLFFTILEHYIPAALGDLELLLSGRKIRFVKQCLMFDQIMKMIENFVFTDWKFHCENFMWLSKNLNSTDKQIFYTDLNDFDIEGLINSTFFISSILNVNNKLYEPDLKTIQKQYFRASLVKWTTLVILLLCVYGVSRTVSRL